MMSRSNDRPAVKNAVTMQAELAFTLTLPFYQKRAGQTGVSTFVAIVQMGYVGI